jgi:hypothetical protein
MQLSTPLLLAVAPSLLTWLTLIFCTTTATAATIRLDHPPDIPGSISLQGEIVVGDAERLVLALVERHKQHRKPFPVSLYLDSNGGSVREALRIAEIVRAVGLVVVVQSEQKAVCLSSCFLIYVSAIERFAAGIEESRLRTEKAELGPIGIHRPYLDDIGGGHTAARRQEEVMLVMRDYLTRLAVPSGLIDKMMTSPSNDVYWLSSTEIQSLGRFPPGVEEQLIAKCGYNAKADRSVDAYLEADEAGVHDCVAEHMTRTFGSYRKSTLSRLTKGWRPWHQERVGKR